jgi:phenylpyruvate tautomerase
MPCLNLYTNVSLDGVDTSALLAEATMVVADVIQKPRNVCSIPLPFFFS